MSTTPSDRIVHDDDIVLTRAPDRILVVGILIGCLFVVVPLVALTGSEFVLAWFWVLGIHHGHILKGWFNDYSHGHAHMARTAKIYFFSLFNIYLLYLIGEAVYSWVRSLRRRVA